MCGADSKKPWYSSTVLAPATCISLLQKSLSSISAWGLWWCHAQKGVACGPGGGYDAM